MAFYLWSIMYHYVIMRSVDMLLFKEELYELRLFIECCFQPGDDTY